MSHRDILSEFIMQKAERRKKKEGGDNTWKFHLIIMSGSYMKI